MRVLRLSKKSFLLQAITNLHCTQSLPCVKGGGSLQGETEGLCGKIYEFALVFGKYAAYNCNNPSVMLFA